MPHDRSYLFAAGSDPAAIGDAYESAADAVIIDLEDTVAPAAKERARTNALDAVPEWADRDQSVGVRVNGLDTAHGVRDVEAVAGATHRPDFVVLPDVRGPDEVAIVADVLDEYDADPEVIALVENPGAAFAAPDIAAASERVRALGFASIDFQKNMGMSILGETDLSVPRYLVSMAAHGAGVRALDTVNLTAVDDDERTRAEAEAAKSVGYDGKFAMTPGQAEAINDAFSPSAAEVDRARRVVEAFEDADEGLVTVEGAAVDKPVVDQLRDVVERAERPD